MSKQVSEEAYMAERIAAMSAPAWTSEEFEDGVKELVDSCRPSRIGAVVQILGEAMDAAIVGWVVDFGEFGAFAFRTGEQRQFVKLDDAERAVDYFRCPPLVSNRLVWTG
jgi:hypothetical protein